MVKFLATRILKGNLTLEEVPESLRAEVEEYLKEQNK